MSYPINYPTPQGANVQMFYRTQDWVKPQGASFVFFTLIGGGGGYDTTNGRGGSSAAVTNFMCPAFLIPDILRVNVARGVGFNNVGENTTVVYQQKDGTGYALLTANGGGLSGPGSGGAAMTANFFTAMGFLTSTAGNEGSTAGGAGPFTFLSSGSASGGIGSLYGYPAPGINGPGYFIMQPIINGVGSQGGARAGFGCGSGGDGLAVIITW